VVAPLCKDRLSEKGRILLTRILIVVIGGYVLYWGLFYQGREDIWDYMAITGAIYFTGAFSLLLFGLYWKRASSTGAFLALLAGVTAVFGLTPVQDSLDLQNMVGFELTGARVGLITVGFSMTVMVLGSLLFPDRRKKSLESSPVKGGE
jgi:SSS family solute:Na+ symporter